jgi:hypothetical protein
MIVNHDYDGCYAIGIITTLMKDLFSGKERRSNRKKQKQKKEADRSGTYTGWSPGEYPVKPLTRRDAMEPFRMTVTLN